jgi:hypothetical protein
MATFNKNVFSSTYRDDYADSDNYYRVLFNAGKSLQARELTQLQTIIQGEISRFGYNIFKDGSAVNPGGPTLNSAYEFVKLNTSSNVLPADTSTLIDAVFTGGTSTVQFKVLQVVVATGSDPDTIYGKYVSTSGGTAGANPVRLTPGETITSGAITLTVQTTNTTANPAVGTGVQISNAKGDFFVLGRFVFVAGQSILLSKYTNTVSAANVGFKVTQDIVTESNSDKLYDNTGSNPNLSSPGAHRYRIVLTLIEEADVASSDMFVFYCKIQNTKIVLDVKDDTNNYNIIGDELAKRTFEESGNYIVKPFKVNIENTDSDAFKVNVSSGLGYINGYRAYHPQTTSIISTKPTAFETVNNQNIPAVFGNYVLFDSADGLPRVDLFDSADILSSQTYAAANKIGKARIRSIEADGSNYRAYLFDVKLRDGKSFRNARAIGNATTNKVHLLRPGGTTSIKEPAENNLLFDLPRTRPQSISDISLTVQRYHSLALNASGVGTFTLTAAGETFTDNTSWVMSNTTGLIVTPDVTPTGAGTQSTTITDASQANNTIDVLYYVNVGTGAVKTKSLTETTVTRTLTVDSDGTYLDLAKADILEVTRIRLGDSAGVDLTSSFTVDNGQRDNYYGNGRLLLNPGASVSGNVFARIKYFAHGSTGNFFGVNSYTGQVDYDAIPNHRLANGTLVNLRDVVDFRPTVDSGGENYTGTNGQVINIPQNTDAIQADVSYYLGRADVLTLSEEGVVELTTGQPAVNPQFPTTPSNVLPIYQINMGPNTLDYQDAQLKQLKYKHFKMADIARLEERLNSLKETTALSLLELDTKNLDVLDAAGANRTKAGFLVDNFKGFGSSAIDLSEYRASIDLAQGLLKPRQSSNDIQFNYSSGLSTNTVKKGDVLLLNYSEADYLQQGLSSWYENINPFNVVTNKGVLTLSPASDNWKSEIAADPLFPLPIQTIPSDPSLIANEWESHWAGVDFDTVSAGDVVGTDIGSTTVGNRTTTTTSDLVITSIENVTESLGNTVLNTVSLPNMRSRKVYFEAHNLSPTTRYFPFFAGTDVSSWVKSETFVQISDASDVDKDPGNQFSAATSHPSTASTLTSNADGYLSGSFFVPDTTAVSFKSGEAEFKLLDINRNDDELATSIARATFSSKGVLETVQESFQVIRKVEVDTNTTRSTSFVANWDPLAQTFRVTEDDGIFLTKVRVYFKTKDTSGPVICQIRPVVNGHPDSSVIRTSVIKNASAITSQTHPTTAAANYTENLTNILANGTDFTFTEPVYLSGGTEYAIVLVSDSNKFNVYTATTGDFVIGSTEKSITTQPSLGSLFKSQNGSTWEPSQKQDLMYKTFKCAFNTSGSAVLQNVNVPLAKSRASDAIVTTATDATIRARYPHHGLLVSDRVRVLGLDSATSYGGMKGSSIVGTRVVTGVDDEQFTFEADSAADSDGFHGGSLVRFDRNYKFGQTYPNIQSIVPRGASLNAAAVFHTSKSLAGTETAYTALASTPLRLRKNNVFDTVRGIFSPTMETHASGLNGGKSAAITLTMATTNTDVSPVIDLQRASLIVTDNIIDDQDTVNPIIETAETIATAGTHAAKHITKPITLAEGATGIKVLIAVNRPSAAGIKLYYRVAEDGVNLNDTAWVLKPVESTIAADDNRNVFREYEYVIGGESGTLDEFTQFQLKIVMTSTNQARVPVIRDLRAIALVD